MTVAEAAPEAGATAAAQTDREPAAMGVRSAAIWSMGGQYISFAVQFASSVIISRLFLTPAEVGLFSIGLAAALLVSILQDFGLYRYISALPRLERAEVERCSSVALLFSLAIAVIIAAAAWPMARAYAQPGLAPILLVIAASYLFVPLSVVPLALMARNLQFRGHFMVNVGGAVAQGSVALSLAAAGWSAMALAWATLAAALARGLIAQWHRPAPPWPLRLGGVAEVLHFGSRSSALYLTGALGTRSPDLIVGKLLSLAAVGLYSRASSLADQLRVLVAGAIGGVFFPAFARLRDRGEPLGPAYLRVCAGYTGVLWPSMAALALAAEPIVRSLYGEQWLGAVPLLQRIALLELFVVTLPLHIDLPILAGRIHRLMALNLVDTLLSVSLLALGCWLGGVEGAASSRLVYGACWIALYARFMHQVVGFDVRALLGIHLRSAVATLAALAPMALAYRFWLPPERMGLVPLAVVSALGILAWLATLWLVRHPLREEIRHMAQRILPAAGRLLPA
ncbi:oligosaccharide flippase family protein [Novosphingobium bradum]|uniref:Oligosaccharide flippase family protein n=1 Tax=Novosphingobium bradum TaxID=1737444 RepID=A0ABV7ITW0_9SPHN